MLPSLRLFGGVAIPSYGLMLFISFMVGIVLFDRRVRRQGVLPATLRYSTAWLLTDVGLALVVLAAGIWAGFLAPSQWQFLKDRPASFVLVFRIAALGLMVYLEYGSIRHILAQQKRREVDGAEFTTYLALWVLFSAIIGSRLLYIVLHPSEFVHDPALTFAFWRGGLQGLMFFGGLVGALVMGIAFALLNRLPLLRLLDAAMPSIVLGEFFTRIGCFLNGCCWGDLASLPWAISFPRESFPWAAQLGKHLIEPSAAHSLPIHPTQLYSSLAGLILFGIALLLERRRWRPGILFGVMLFLYAGFRFGIDFVRSYENSANLWSNQAISLGLCAIGLAVAGWQMRRAGPVKDTAGEVKHREHTAN
jgi:phosphatidylglycerol:prolipoprotein diacylglycerol transferase